MQAVHFLRPKAINQSVAQHLTRAGATVFFSRLEDQQGHARKVTVFCQMTCRQKQHRHMPVMATSMHPAGHFRGMVNSRCLSDRQRVHVRAQCADKTRPRPTDYRDNTAFPNPRNDFVHAMTFEGRDNPFGRAWKVELQFGMTV